MFVMFSDVNFFLSEPRGIGNHSSQQLLICDYLSSPVYYAKFGYKAEFKQAVVFCNIL